MNTRKIGAEYEEYAARYLTQAGYRIAARNFRCRQGEIDIAAWDLSKEKPCLVFVEVKYRRGRGAGYPEEGLTLRKRRTIIRVAEFFCARYRIGSGTPCRFDVIAIEGSQIRHTQDAFQMEP